MSDRRDRSLRRRRREEGPAIGHRLERLQTLLSQELASCLRDDVTDPRLRGLRVVQLDLSPDYANARVLVAAPARPEPAEAQRIDALLEQAEGFLRARLAAALDLKRVPRLRLRCDRDLS